MIEGEFPGLRPPVPGDQFTGSTARSWVEKINRIEERGFTGVPQVGIAVTCEDDGSYPDVDDSPMAFPFAWLHLFDKAEGTLPVAKVSTQAEHEFLRENLVVSAKKSGPPDGYALSRVLRFKDDESADAVGSPNPKHEYIPAGKIVVVTFWNNHFWMSPLVSSRAMVCIVGAGGIEASTDSGPSVGMVKPLIVDNSAVPPVFKELEPEIPCYNWKRVPIRGGARVWVDEDRFGSLFVVSHESMCKAEWIKFRYVPGQGFTNLLAHYSGPSPVGVGEVPDIDYPLGEPCDEADVMAFCDENTGRYQAVATESAMLGESEQMNIVNSLAFDGCGINYVVQPARVFPCQSQPSLVQITPDLVEREVITGAALQEAIEGCEGTCEYSWNEALQDWTLPSSPQSLCGDGCECGPPPSAPGSFDGETVIVPCVRSDGQTPRPARLFFSSERVLVCSFMAYSGFEIPLAECPEY